MRKVIWWRNYILALIIICVFGGCVEQIEFEREETEIVLVVEGRIAMGNAPSKLKLSMSSPYGVERGEPVPFAQITVFDDLGNSEAYIEDPLKPGTYHTEGNLEGVAGRAYHIEIELDNGSVYRSLPDTMPERFRIDRAYFDLTKYSFFNEFGFEVTRDRIRIFVDTSFPLIKKGPYFRWESEEVWRFSEADQPWNPLYFPKTCYIKERTSPQFISLYNGDLQETSQIENKMVAFRRVNYSFLEKHYFNIYQMSLSAEAYAYWDRVDRVTNQIGSIFDAPPATVRSNVYNVDNPDEIVLGYFESAAIDTARFFTLPRDLPGINITPFCEADFRFSPPRFNERCTNCLLVPNSTLVRPDYF